MRRGLAFLIVSALFAVSGSVASAAAVRPTLQITYVTPKVSQRGFLTVRASVAPKTTRCKLALRGPGAHVVNLPVRRSGSGKLQWTYRVPNGTTAGSWTARVSCAGQASASRSFVVQTPVLKANVIASQDGFTQSNYTDSVTSQTFISYGVVLKNETPDVDALDVGVTVSFSDTLGRSATTETTTLTGIPAGTSFYLGGLASSNVSLTVASMKVSVTVGFTQARQIQLPPVSGLSFQTDDLGDGSVSGMFENPYTQPISTGGIYVVYLNSQGAVVGGASTSTGGASVEPGASVAFGLSSLNSDLNSSFVPPSSVATIDGSVDPCSPIAGLWLAGSSCPAEVPAQAP